MSFERDIYTEVFDLDDPCFDAFLPEEIRWPRGFLQEVVEYSRRYHANGRLASQRKTLWRSMPRSRTSSKQPSSPEQSHPSPHTPPVPTASPPASSGAPAEGEARFAAAVTATGPSGHAAASVECACKCKRVSCIIL